MTMTDEQLDALTRQIRADIAANPDAMRRIQDRAFDIGVTLALSGEEAAVQMLVADGVPERMARRNVRGIVTAVAVGG